MRANFIVRKWRLGEMTEHMFQTKEQALDFIDQEAKDVFVNSISIYAFIQEVDLDQLRRDINNKRK